MEDPQFALGRLQQPARCCMAEHAANPALSRHRHARGPAQLGGHRGHGARLHAAAQQRGRGGGGHPRQLGRLPERAQRAQRRQLGARRLPAVGTAAQRGES